MTSIQTRGSVAVSRIARPLLLAAAVLIAVTPVASRASDDGSSGLHGPLAKSTRIALASPYVFTPEAQLVSEPEWQKNFKQGLDRAKLVGYPWFFFSVQ